MWTLSAYGVWLYYFFACVAHGSLHLRAAVKTMFTYTRTTQYTSTKGKKEKTCLCLVVEQFFFFLIESQYDILIRGV